MTRLIAQLFRILSVPTRAGIGASALLLALERLVLAASAIGMARRYPTAIGGAALVLALWALRGSLRQYVLRDVRRRVTLLVAETALSRKGSDSYLKGAEGDAAVFEGRYAAEQLLARQLPSLVGEATAGTVLLVVARPTGLPVLAILGAVVLLGALLSLLQRSITRYQQAAWKHYVHVAERTLTSVRAATDLIASGHEGEYLVRLRRAVDDWTLAASRAERRSALFQRLPVALIVVPAVVVSLWTRALQVDQVVRLAVLFPPLAGLAGTAFEMLRAAPRVQVLGPALAANEQPPPATRGKPPPDLPCEIQFDRVSFAYGSRTALREISFTWVPGQLLGIQGHNGSGKSTLLKLLLGLVQPTRGTISVGGVDLRDVDLPAWRRNIVYLPQQPYLPPKCTVFEAMQLTAPDLTESEARAALMQLGTLDRLHRLDRGEPLHLPVASLSVGERQRVLLSRMFARPTALVFLDEPDENLDGATRVDLAEKLGNLERPRMVAVATHDPTLLGLASCRVNLASETIRQSITTR